MTSLFCKNSRSDHIRNLVQMLRNQNQMLDRYPARPRPDSSRCSGGSPRPPSEPLSPWRPRSSRPTPPGWTSPPAGSDGPAGSRSSTPAARGGTSPGWTGSSPPGRWTGASLGSEEPSLMTEDPEDPTRFFWQELDSALPCDAFRNRRKAHRFR